jgi:tRNA dimethylallyltransferase
MSELALKIAKEFNGEIIAADSRTIYKGMDIGTAKPSNQEQKQVKHWGVDLVNPGHVFTAYQFKEYAEGKIKEIQKRGKLPILVGGTGLYIDSVLFDFGFVEPGGAKEREVLEKLSVEQLQEVIWQKSYEMPENMQNRRHLIRTLERKGETGTREQKLRQSTVVIGLMPASKTLKKRIEQRSEAYLKRGLEQETVSLLRSFGKKPLEKSGGIAYQAAVELLSGKINREEAIEMIKKQEWQYARRQRTWFKRNKFINWFDSPAKAYPEIRVLLNN